jgi:hypothetical protein
MSNRVRVAVHGSEWPRTEWDVPNAWYHGEIVRETKAKVFVKFDGEDEEIGFTRESLSAYQEMYASFKFSNLLKAVESLMC